MAPKKSEDATLEDLERIFEEHGHKPQIAYGLAVAARNVWNPIWGERTELLLALLDQEYYPDRADPRYEVPLAGEIYGEVVQQLLEVDSSLGLSGEQFQRLVNFLGQHSPLEGIRGKVRTFLALTSRGSIGIKMIRTVPTYESLTRALLRYQMYGELEQLVEDRVYEAIPVLFEAVMEQVGEGNVPWLKTLVYWGWDDMADSEIVAAFRSMGSDTRVLRLLLDLSQAYIDEHGRWYKLPDDDSKERRRSVAY